MLHKVFPVALRLLIKPVLGPNIPVGIQRFWSSALLMPNRPAKKTSFELVSMGGIPARQIAPATTSDKVVLYLHGGAYILGTPKSHRALCSHLASFAGATVYSVDYRLAPEHPYPAALEDALSAYQALLNEGVATENITIAGDSAGGGLAVATLLNIRDKGMPTPAGAFLISPWVDMTYSGESMQSKHKDDPMLSRSWLSECGNKYRGDIAAEHPDCSPLFADLSNLPPILIHVGSNEVLLDDSLRFEQALTSQGNQISLRVFDDYWHDFQLDPAMLPMARESLQAAADFINRS